MEKFYKSNGFKLKILNLTCGAGDTHPIFHLYLKVWPELYLRFHDSEIIIICCSFWFDPSRVQTTGRSKDEHKEVKAGASKNNYIFFKIRVDLNRISFYSKSADDNMSLSIMLKLILMNIQNQNHHFSAKSTAMHMCMCCCMNPSKGSGADMSK